MAEEELQDDGTIAEDIDTFADVAPMDSGLEAVLSTLTVGDFVAQGGQAQVHRVTKGDVDVAARSVSFREDDDQIKRLQREARLLRGLQHPNIVGYRGYEANPVRKRWGTDIEYTFYMDFIKGPTLRDILEEGKFHRELSGSETDTIFAEIGSALSYCHDRGILHRDIKPSNVKLMEGDIVKVIDFGLVKKEGESTMTGSEGRFLGSYKYAAPEVRNGKSATAASDWYSAAVTAVELLEGKPYTKIVDPADVRGKLSKKTFLPPRLKQSLELLLEEDPVVRAANVERVKRLYGLGKTTVVVESIGEKKGVPWIGSDDFAAREKRDVVWGDLEAHVTGSATLGGAVGLYGSSKNRKDAIRQLEQLELKELETRVIEDEGAVSTVTGATIETAMAEVSNPLESKVSEPSTALAEYNKEASVKRITKITQGGILGLAPGGLWGLWESYVNMRTNNNSSVTHLLMEMVLGSAMGAGIGYLYHKWRQVPQLRKKYGLEDKIGESDAEKSIASLTAEEKTAKISEARMAWDKKRSNHALSTAVDTLYAAVFSYIGIDKMEYYGSKLTTGFLAIAGIAGIDLARNIVRRRKIKKNLELLESNPDQALVLYEEEKKGLVERTKERYNHWREEKGREWVRDNSSDDVLKTLWHYRDAKYVSSSTLRRRVLPCIQNKRGFDNYALQVITKHDPKKEFAAIVRANYDKLKDDKTRAMALQYIIRDKNYSPDECYEKYILPALRGEDERFREFAFIDLLSEIKRSDRYDGLIESREESEAPNYIPLLKEAVMGKYFK